MTRVTFNLDAQSKLNLEDYKVSIDNFRYSNIFLQILRCFAKYYFYLWWENFVNSAKYETSAKSAI